MSLSRRRGLATGVGLLIPGLAATVCLAGTNASDPATSSSCPSQDQVWAVVEHLVPSAAAELAQSKSAVQIVDLGDRYRVRIAAPQRVVEREHLDTLRECDKRARFAAELIVVTLMPPHLTLDEMASQEAIDGGLSIDDGGPSSAPVASVTQTDAAVPPDAQALPPRPHRSLGMRFEVTGVADYAPHLLDAPPILAWGAEFRLRAALGSMALVTSLGLRPEQPFRVGDFRGAMLRIPAGVGIGWRSLDVPVNLQTDLLLVAAFEQYKGESPSEPRSATRLTPGLELAVIAAPLNLAAFSPLLGLRGSLFPFRAELDSAPQVVGKTATLWLSVSVGVAWNP